ncbi:hypothetical protein [Chamaesiphon sp. GL140_3_metabinner_50]|uniref:hypothetical protein n=1 Tax=Chamaesiphon sp. GL140_3_metabinner_50 TaxID=2970812 RepID=UPI0025D5CCA2|nr:hypothetical protein [Chamaesiphon sp. GL140_3_metabinner_50]
MLATNPTFPLFQSLKGFDVDFDPAKEIIDKHRPHRKFQSLKGFDVDFDGGKLEASIYLVFKVRMREPRKS